MPAVLDSRPHTIEWVASGCLLRLDGSFGSLCASTRQRYLRPRTRFWHAGTQHLSCMQGMR